MKLKQARFLAPATCLLILLFLASVSAAADTAAPENRAAVVNGKVISQDTLSTEFNLLRERVSRQGRPLSEDDLDKLKKEVLENLINVELLYQQSQKQKIVVEKEAVEKQLSQFKGRFPSEADFKNAIAKMGVSEPVLRSKIKEGIAIHQLLRGEVEENVKVTDKETRDFYDGNPQLFLQPEKVRASHILIKVDPNADENTRAEAKKKIAGVQKRLESGEDFSAVAMEVSEGPSGPKGGDLGYFRRGQMVKPFEDAAFKLKPGTVSDVVETRFGYHLIKLVDHQPESMTAYEEVKERLEQHLRNQKTKTGIQKYIEKLKGAASIEKFL